MLFFSAKNLSNRFSVMSMSRACDKYKQTVTEFDKSKFASMNFSRGAAVDEESQAANSS